MIKLIPLLAGVSALAITVAPLGVKAEPPTTPLNQDTSQVRSNPGMAGLELTEAQKSQMAEIKRDTRTQIEAILTPEQRQQFQTARRNRQGRRSAFAAMNLTEEQKAQIKEITKSARSRMEAILTPEQREQMQQRRQAWREQRQQRRQ